MGYTGIGSVEPFLVLPREQGRRFRPKSAVIPIFGFTYVLLLLKFGL